MKLLGLKVLKHISMKLVLKIIEKIKKISYIYDFNFRHFYNKLIILTTKITNFKFILINILENLYILDLIYKTVRLKLYYEKRIILINNTFDHIK